MSDIIQEQIEYYRARASEYDEWFFRQGRYNRGKIHCEQWFSEIAEVEQALKASNPMGEILELACGTGLWTQHLVSDFNHVTAIDAAPEVIEINKQRVKKTEGISYIVADIFRWIPQQQYDFVFFGFWLSHVPAENLVSFWSMVKSALKPEGRVFFVDSVYHPESTAKDNYLPDTDSEYAKRMLNNGQSYTIIKKFYDDKTLDDLTKKIGLSGFFQSTKNYFFYGNLVNT